MSLSLSLGLGLTSYRGGGAPWSPAGMFTNNEPGFVLPVDPQFLFQNAAGTIPVTSPGDPVGLRLDVSRMGGKGLVQFLAGQPELDTGDPGSVARIYAVYTWNTSTRTLTITGAGSNGSYPRISINCGLVTGRRYAVSGRLEVQNTGVSGVRLATGGVNNQLAYDAATGQFWGNQAAGSAVIEFHVDGRLTGTVRVAELSIKEIPGNHFVQTTDSARPAYQIDGNGKPCLVYDGSDDFMVSAANVDFSATDEMLVCTGIHKASDAAAGMVIEYSEISPGNNGSFYVISPSNNNLPNLALRSRGTANATITHDPIAAPVTAIMTGRSKISTPNLNLRINGSVVGNNNNTQGTGNYGNYPMFIGRRAGSTLPFNGRDYGITVLGRLPTDDELARVEAYYAKAAGVTL